MKLLKLAIWSLLVILPNISSADVVFEECKDWVAKPMPFKCANGMTLAYGTAICRKVDTRLGHKSKPWGPTDISCNADSVKNANQCINDYMPETLECAEELSRAKSGAQKLDQIPTLEEPTVGY